MAGEELKRALDGRGKKGKTHTHGIHYERADNGGYVAHVHKHHGKGPHSEGHSHIEEHVLPNAEAAQEHFDEHMGDHPEVGEMAQAGAPAEGQEQEPEPQAAGQMTA